MAERSRPCHSFKIPSESLRPRLFPERSGFASGSQAKQFEESTTAVLAFLAVPSAHKLRLERELFIWAALVTSEAFAPQSRVGTVLSVLAMRVVRLNGYILLEPSSAMLELTSNISAPSPSHFSHTT
ncbi:hypothetical protein B0H16DRAFT_1464369 [Mycena metata]|uniref:Uncharacterized protein n=1 Tax=Mycena metata TaxID=1033252 RepID=A0AAD7IGB1_9AGAR|nr:hypothetical protein B0H16DRAFT_1464369 [Mycena metata]